MPPTWPSVFHFRSSCFSYKPRCNDVDLLSRLFEMLLILARRWLRQLCWILSYSETWPQDGRTARSPIAIAVVDLTSHAFTSSICSPGTSQRAGRILVRSTPLVSVLVPPAFWDGPHTLATSVCCISQLTTWLLYARNSSTVVAGGRPSVKCVQRLAAVKHSYRTELSEKIGVDAVSCTCLNSVNLCDHCGSPVTTPRFGVVDCWTLAFQLHRTTYDLLLIGHRDTNSHRTNESDDWRNKLFSAYNPLGNLNSGRRPWAKLIRNASLQRVFDAAIAKLLWRLVSRCFYESICVCFYDNVELSRMRCNSTKRL